MCLSWNSHTTRTLYAYRAQDNKTPVTRTGSAGECRYQFTCSLAHTDTATPTKYLPSEHTHSATLYTQTTPIQHISTHTATLCAAKFNLILTKSSLQAYKQTKKDTTIKYGNKTLPFDISTLIVN